MVPERLPGWGTMASLAVHLGLAAALILLSPLRPLVVPPPEPVSVQLVTEQQFQAIASPAPPVLAAPEAQPDVAPAPAAGAATESATPAKTDRGVITAHEFYAAAILKEPGMARIRA